MGDANVPDGTLWLYRHLEGFERSGGLADDITPQMCSYTLISVYARQETHARADPEREVISDGCLMLVSASLFIEKNLCRNCCIS